jgi:hypothetical protein
MINADNDWSPFASRAGFELSEFMSTDAELSRRKIDRLLELWAATLVPHGSRPPIVNARDLHCQIDAIKLGDVEWEKTCLEYNGPRPETTRPPEWKTSKYDVWYRNPREVIKNLLARPDLEGQVDYTPYREFEGERRQYGNFMSGNWSWRQAVCSIHLIVPQTRLITHPTGSHRTGSLNPWLNVCAHRLRV